MAAELPRIRYGGDAAFAPFESLDPQGRPRGFQIDLLAELGSAIGVAFDIALQPWAQTEADFRAGRLDLVAMVDTVERRSWARFTRGHATPALAVYRRHDRPEPHGLQDLAGLRIAVLDHDAMRDTVATWLTGMRGPILPLADAAEALAAVQQGRADVALLPRAYADPLLTAGAASGVAAGRMNLSLQTYALAVAPQRDALHAQLQQGLDTLEGNGRLEALRVRWLSSHRDVADRSALEQGLAQQRMRTWGLAGASAAALLLLGTGVWVRGRRIATERQGRLDAEQALQRAEEVLARTFANHPDPMLIVERGSAVVRDANAALLALLGATAGSLIGRSLASLAQHVDAQAMQQLVQLLDGDGLLDAAPLRLRRADDTVRDCLVSADVLDIDGVAHVFCIVRDITEPLAGDAAMRTGYEALAAQLAQSRRELDAARAAQALAEGSQHEFTRAVAHDLKTPLNAVQGFAGLLRQRLLAGHVQEAAGYADHIERAAQRMAAMIDALARLAQVARRPLRRQPVDMQQLVRDTWALLVASRPGPVAGFRVEGLPAAQADPDLAAQVLQNLLENAWKYSAGVDAAQVAVDSYRDGRGTWYRITDNGVGFDMGRAQALFQPFQRLHAASRFEGTGVGLSLVRRIVDHHGGEVRLRSAPGAGTVAEFTLDPPPGPGQDGDLPR